MTLFRRATRLRVFTLFSGVLDPFQTFGAATTLKMARRLVGWYALRWGIECWHRVLKVVAGVERRQFKSAQALERALALDMIISSRVLLLNRLGKEHSELPAELQGDFMKEICSRKWVLESRRPEGNGFCVLPTVEFWRLLLGGSGAVGMVLGRPESRRDIVLR